MKMLFFLLICFCFFVLGISQIEASNKTSVYFFWGDGCPYCAPAKEFLEELEEKYDNLEVKMFETWRDRDNAEIFQEMADAYGTQARGVPATFIGDNSPIFGFTDRMKSDIRNKIENCLEQGCVDPGVKSGLVEEVQEEVSEEDPVSEPEEVDHPQPEETETEDPGKKPIQDPDSDKHEPCLHFFYKDNCPQCEGLLKSAFLDDLEKEYDIDIRRYNINNKEDELLYQSLKQNYGLTSGAYPIIFLGDKYYIGENTIKDNLEEQIVVCKKEGCPCPIERIDAVTPQMPRTSDFTPEEEQKVDLPLLGTVDFAGTPLFITTAIIAFVDGFNPCSLWLITFLLGIVVYTGSRKKTILVGTTFLLVTSAAYAFFMVGFLNVFMYIGYLSWIQLVVALIAITFAVVNIKDYFWYKKGISFTIPDRYKPKIFKKVRGVVKKEQSTGAMLLGTVGLALGVVLVELPCTAGFPMIWTNILAQNQVAGMAFALLLLLYISIYMFIELVIVLSVAFKLKNAKFEEKHGRILKLIGGMIMLALGMVMLIDPDLMHNIGGIFVIFGGSILASFIIMWVHRWLLPQMDVKIGTEKDLLDSKKDESFREDGKDNN